MNQKKYILKQEYITILLIHNFGKDIAMYLQSCIKNTLIHAEFIQPHPPAEGKL